MNSKEALENIVINFDNMGMICSNLGYEEFYSKDLHFKDIFKTEYESILKDLDRLEKLEKENKELKNTILSLELDTCIPKLRKENKELRNSIKSWDETAGNLLKENIKLKKAIEILKGFKIDLIDYCDGHYSLDILYDTGGLTKEQYELLKEILENE